MVEAVEARSNPLPLRVPYDLFPQARLGDAKDMFDAEGGS